MHNVFFNETFWVAISIILIIAIIFKYSKLPVKEFLNKKAASISHKINEAMLLQSEAEKMLKEQRELYQKFTQQAQEILQSSKEEAILLTKRAQEEFIEKLEHKNALIKQKIHDGEVRVLRHLRLKAVEQSIAISIIILSQKENNQLKTKLLNDALTAVEAKFAA